MSDASELHRRLEALLAEFGSRLKALIRNQCGPKSALDPDDVEQEVRIRLWQAIERDRNAAFGASYIQRVVVSAVIDAHRRATVRAAEPLPDEGSSEQLVDPERPDRSASSDQRMKLLEQAITELPIRRQAPLRLHLQGFSLVDIAKLTNSTDEAVRKLVTRGLTDLKARLAELGIEAGDGHAWDD